MGLSLETLPEVETDSSADLVLAPDRSRLANCWLVVYKTFFHGLESERRRTSFRELEKGKGESARELLLQGSFYEVSLALVGVVSLALLQYAPMSSGIASTFL